MAYADCQPAVDLHFAVDITSMLPQKATETTTATSQETRYPLQSCTDIADVAIQYQMGQSADLSSQSIDIGERRFYKIRAVQGISAGNAAINYLIQHAYVAFSIRSKETFKVNVAQPNDQLDLVLLSDLENGTSLSAASISLTDIQFYFDAIPHQDEIIEKLTTQQINLNVGKLNIQFTDQDNAETSSLSMAPSLIMNINGIRFQRATCFVKKQNVQLAPLVVSAVKAGVAVGGSKAFDVDLQCNGYLNQREAQLTWLDNNDLNNQNEQGYLSSVKGNSFSNVGVQIVDEKSKPIQIGQAYAFIANFSGQEMKKSYAAQYYLPNGQPTVGVVNAQATLQIQYR